MPKNVQHTISTDIRLTGGAAFTRDINALKAELNKFNQQLKLNNAQYKENAQSLEALTSKQEILQGKIKNLNGFVAFYREEQERLSKALQNNADRQEELTARLGRYESAIEGVKRKLAEDEERTRALNAEKEKYQNTIQKITEKYGENSSALNIWKGKLQDVEKRIAENNETTQKHREQLEKLTAGYEKNSSELKALPELAKNYSRQLATAEGNEAKYTLQLMETSSELGKVKEGIEVVTDAHKELEDAVEDSAEAFEDSSEAMDDEINTLTKLATEFVNRRILEDFKALVDVLKQSAQASRDFESSLTSVQKTSDFTEKELEEFATQVKSLSLSLPITTDELNSIAEKAGQLGVAKQDIIDFTEVMAKMGVSTNISAEHAAESLAQITSITGMASENYERLASTIVALGNNFATGESNIVNFTQRIAATASNVGFTEAQMVALATAVSSVGMQADAGGTAMQSLINKMQAAIESGEGLENWAEVMGVTTEELVRLWGDDASTALLKFVQGLGKLEGSMTSTLKDLGVGEQRLIRTVTSLANAEEKTGLLTRALDMSNEAWEQNTALTTEASKRFETSESKLIMFQNSIENLKVAVGDQLNPALNNLYGLGENIMTGVADFINEHPAIVDAIVGITVAMGALAAQQTVVTGAFSEWMKNMMNADWSVILDPTKVAIAAVVALGAAFFTMVSRSEDVVAENKKLVKSLADVRKEVQDSVNSTKEENDETANLVSTLESLANASQPAAESKQMMLEIVERLNEQIPSLNLGYDLMANRLYNVATNATMTADDIKDIAKALASQRAEEERIEALTQLYVNRQRLEEELTKRKLELAVAQKNANEELAKYGELSSVTEGKVQSLTTIVADLEKELLATNEAIDGNNGNGGLTESTTKLSASLEYQKETARQNTEQQKKLRNELELLEAEFNEAAKAAKEKLAGEVAGAFDEVTEASKMQYSTVMDNLQSQIDFYTKYSDNINNLNNRNINGLQEMLKQMQDEGKLTADVAATMAAMTDKELSNVVKAWQGVQSAQEAASKNIAEVQTNYSDKISKIKKDLENLTNRTYTVKVAYDDSGKFGGPYMKYAQGLEYVPYDDYAALLHEGEMVLTRAEARAYRQEHSTGQSITNNTRNFGGVTLNVYSRQGQNIDELADEIMYRIEDATKRKEAVWA